MARLPWVAEIRTGVGEATTYVYFRTFPNSLEQIKQVELNLQIKLFQTFSSQRQVDRLDNFLGNFYSSQFLQTTHF